MKLENVVNQIAGFLPKYSDAITTNISIVSLTRSGTTVTAETSAAHNLSVSSQVNIVGAETPLTISSLTRSGTIGTLVTDNVHDVTEGSQDNVLLSGSNEAEFNGTFTIISVPNRNTITFTMVDSGPTTATGSPLLINGSSYLQQYNGLKEVATVPDTTHFTYEITDATLYTPAAGTIVAKTLPRVSMVADPELALDAYTEQSPGKVWMFAYLGDVSASKSRDINSDATDNLQRGNQYRQQLIFPFSILAFFPAADMIAGAQARDDAEELFKPLCQTLLGKKFDSLLYAANQNPVSFVSHGIYGFHSAFYVHQYNFETIADLTFNDTIGYDDDVAFRDIDLDMTLNIGTQEDSLTITVDLDES